MATTVHKLNENFILRATVSLSLVSTVYDNNTLIPFTWELIKHQTFFCCVLGL